MHSKQDKKPSAKTKYKLPKSLEQDCKGGGRCSRTILQPSSQRLRHFKTMKPRRNKSLGGGNAFEIKSSYPSRDLQKPSRRMELFLNKSHHEGWNTYKLKPSQRMNPIQYKVRHPRIQVLNEATIKPPKEFSDTSTWISKTKAFPIRPAHDNTSAMDMQWSSIKSMVGRHDCLIKKQRVSSYTSLDLSPSHKNP